MSRLREICYRIYWKLEKLIVPGLRNSQYVYKETLEALIPAGGRWLELGCGHQILPEWIRSSREVERSLVNRAQLVVGLDPSFESLRNHPTIRARVVAAIEGSPFRDSSFNVVTANMVMEHVEDPERALSELSRILEPGGIFLLHTPNLLNYLFAIAALTPHAVKTSLIRLLEGRREEDVFPTAYKFNTPGKILEASRQCGFRVIELKLVGSTAVSAVLFPIAVLELMVIRLLECDFAKNYRSNMIVVLQKP